MSRIFFTPISKTHRRALLAAQNYRCAYCPATFGPWRQSTADHVRPKRQGSHRDFRVGLGNVLLACSECNQAKGGRAPHPCELLALMGVNLDMHRRGWLHPALVMPSALPGPRYDPGATQRRAGQA